MYITSCRKKLQQIIRPQKSLNLKNGKKISRSEGPIPIDGRSFITHECNGHYMLWDQRNYPAALPVATIEEPVARLIIRHTTQGKKLLRDLYSDYEKRMQEQATVNTAPTSGRERIKRDL